MEPDENGLNNGVLVRELRNGRDLYRHRHADGLETWAPFPCDEKGGRTLAVASSK